MLADMYRQKMTAHGYKYVHYEFPPASKGELIDLILTEKPDLILMSMMMQYMDGFTATKYLKEDKRTKGFFIMGLSNIGQQEDIDKLKSYGIDDYIVSSYITPSELLELLDTFFANKDSYVSSFGKYIRSK